jgi:hypothetical protein
MGEKGRVEPFIGERQDVVRFAHSISTVVYSVIARDKLLHSQLFTG